jgi:hypothetical protein
MYVFMLTLNCLILFISRILFIPATSNGSKDSLDNMSGGHCRTHNMKLKITVCRPKGIEI